MIEITVSNPARGIAIRTYFCKHYIIKVEPRTTGMILRSYI